MRCNVRVSAALALSAWSVAACASTKSTSSDLGPSTVMTSQTIASGNTNSGASITRMNDMSTTKTVLSMPMDQAWSALTSAYASIDIKLTVHDVSRHLLGNES